MLPWRRTHIQKNYPELIKNTLSNVALLTRLEKDGLLSSNEVEEVGCKQTCMEKSRKLYEILQTRTDGYTKLILALEEEQQSGAAEILQNYECSFQTLNLISVDKSQVLGKGRSGTKVFRGKFDGREVAVKLVIDNIHQALKEVELLKKLDHHPNIVRYFLAEKYKKKLYIALELGYVNLQDQIDSNLLSIDEYNVVKQCTIGVAFLHRNGIIHRDLKPSNILLMTDAQVKISDFGFSKNLATGASRVTVSGVFGTEDWMAPEVLEMFHKRDWLQGAKISAEADIFALGCLFYFVLTHGEHPFGLPFHRTYKILKNDHDVSYSHLDETWKKPISAMVSKEPNCRPTAEELLIYFEDNIQIASSAIPDSMETAGFAAMQLGTLDVSILSKRSSVLLENRVTKTQRTANPILDEAGSSYNFYDSKTSLQYPNNISNPDKAFQEKLKKLNFPTTYIDMALNNINGTDAEHNPILHLLILQGVDVEGLELCIQRGANVNNKDRNGYSILYTAAINENCEVFKYLYSLVDTSKMNNVIGSTNSCDIYANQNVFHIVREFVKFGTDVNAIDNKGNNLFDIAVLNGRTVKELRDFVKLGVKPILKKENGSSALHLAAKSGNYSVVGYLVSLGFDVNGIDNKTSLKHTPLLYTCDLNDNFLETVRELINFGADFNCVSAQGKTLFTEAVFRGKSVNELSEMVKLGVDPKRPGMEGKSAFHFAAQSGNFEVINFLKSCHLDINEKFGHNGRTPIMFCGSAGTKFSNTIHALVDNGANINALDERGMNVVHIAVVEKRSVEDLEALLKHGAEWNVAENIGSSVLHLAALFDRIHLFEYFLQKGANPYATDKTNQTFMNNSTSTKRRAQLLKCFLRQKKRIKAESALGKQILEIFNSTDILKNNPSLANII